MDSGVIFRLAKPESLGCLFMPGTSSLDRPNDVDFVKLLNQHIPKEIAGKTSLDKWAQP